MITAAYDDVTTTMVPCTVTSSMETTSIATSSTVTPGTVTSQHDVEMTSQSNVVSDGGGTSDAPETIESSTRASIVVNIDPRDAPGK